MAITPELSRRLARTKSTETILQKGMIWWHKMVKSAERNETWEDLPDTYKQVILLAEKEYV